MTSLVYNGKKNINLESGIRFNKHSRYGNNITFTFNPSYIYKNLFKTSLNISSAYKAPTLYQLFDGYSGERNLKPETSITSEASIQLIGIKRINSRVTYFNRRIKHGIDYNYESYKYFNYSLQKDHGLEIELGYKASKWNFSYNYTYTSGKVTATRFEYDADNYIYIPKGDTTYSHLFRIPQHGMNGNLGYQLSKKIFTSISQRIVGKRFEPVYASPSVELNHT
jgi:vitamin B12 transporter